MARTKLIAISGQSILKTLNLSLKCWACHKAPGLNQTKVDTNNVYNLSLL